LAIHGKATERVRGGPGGSAAGDLAGALLAQRTQVNGGPGAVRPPRRGIEGAVDCYVAMARATQLLVILTSS
jgi:hypothetical protein